MERPSVAWTWWGRRGGAELARALGVAPAGTPPPEAVVAPLSATGVRLASTRWVADLSPEPGERALTLHGGGAGTLRLDQPLAPAPERRAPEPVPLEVAPRELERLARGGRFALAAPAGTSKLAFDTAWCGGAAALFRVGDLEGRTFGWAGCGPGLPGATFPLRVSHLEERPLVVAVERVDPATGTPLAWDASGLESVWGAWLGRSCWSASPAGAWAPGAVAGADETIVQTLRGGQVRVDLAWRLSGEIVAVDLEVAVLAHPEPPPLRLGLPAGWRARRSEAPDRVEAAAGGWGRAAAWWALEPADAAEEAAPAAWLGADVPVALTSAGEPDGVAVGVGAGRTRLLLAAG